MTCDDVTCVIHVIPAENASVVSAICLRRAAMILSRLEISALMSFSPVSERERERECVCVCVRERQRERERERERETESQRERELARVLGWVYMMCMYVLC